MPSLTDYRSWCLRLSNLIGLVLQVFKVNGKSVNNLRDLVDIVDACREDNLRFDLQYNATVVIETAVARAATKEVMAMHYIAHDRSADLQAA